MIMMRFVVLMYFFFRVSVSAERTVKGVLELLSAAATVDESLSVSYRCNFLMHDMEGYRLMNLEGDGIDALCKTGLKLEMTVIFLPDCASCVALNDIHSIGGINAEDMHLQGLTASQLRGVAESDSDRDHRVKLLLKEGLNYLALNNHRLLSAQTVSTVPDGPRTALLVMMILDDDSTSNFDTPENVFDYYWKVTYGVDLAYQQSTYGAVSFPPAGVDVITLRLNGVSISTYSGCNYNQMRTDVAAALDGTVNDADNYDHLSMFFPTTLGCGYGLGNVNGKNTWIKALLDNSVMIHELGQ
jgi:hypothetical protein